MHSYRRHHRWICVGFAAVGILLVNHLHVRAADGRLRGRKGHNANASPDRFVEIADDDRLPDDTPEDEWTDPTELEYGPTTNGVAGPPPSIETNPPPADEAALPQPQTNAPPPVRLVGGSQERAFGSALPGT